MSPTKWVCGLAVLGLVLCFSGCTGDVDRYYVVGAADQRRHLRELQRRLARGLAEEEARFIVVQQISQSLAQAGHAERQITFLTSYVQRHPDDPYRASHLLEVAAAYDGGGATPFALRYYRQILRGTADLEVSGESIHLHALLRLKELSTDPRDLILYHQELIARFSDQIDLAQAFWGLGHLYETVGEWDLAIQAFERFLQTGVGELAGFPQARQRMMEKVDFHHSTKDWTIRDLTTLVERIKAAIRSRDISSLTRYRAKTGFFVKSWTAVDSRFLLASDFEISRFLSAQVTIAPELDPSSTNREAYLRLFSAADFRIPIWYLYFRRVEYLPDPEINGNWEWAGIYLGERTIY